MGKILLSAFACCPNKGSEEGVGWSWIESLSKYRELIVITRSFNELGENTKQIITKYMDEKGIKNVTFIFMDLPKRYHKLMHGIPIHIYYILWQKMIYKKLRKNIDRYDIELIHHVTYNEFRSPGYLWRLNKPFLWGPIGGGATYPKGFEELLKDVILFEQFRKIYNLVCCYIPTIRKAMKKAICIFVAEESTQKLLPQKYESKYMRLTEVGIKKINNTMSVKDTMENKEDKLNLIWVGRVIPLKGLPLLIKAISKVKSDITLTVVGDGSGLEEAKKISKELSINNRIRFTNNLTFFEVEKEYLKADVFIFTSLRDATGSVLLEAMSYGLPIICLNHHGAKNVIKKSFGIKINPLTPEYVVDELAKQIDKLAQHKELLLGMKESALKEAEDYLWSKRAEYMDSIYTKVLEKRVKVPTEYNFL